jgi:hypothetical protein
MSIPSQKQGRRRTFRVEALESRELLSTAGHGTHPALVAAPLSRVALVSRTAQDPVIKAKLQGQFLHNGTEITFSAGGFADLQKGQPTPVLFRGTITHFKKTGNDKFTFEKGGAEFFDQYETDDYFVFHVTGGSADKQKFTAGGKTIQGFGASGIFQGTKATFTATGTVNSTGDLSIELKIDYKR